MEEEKERGIISIGSGAGKTTGHIINEIMAQQERVVIVVENKETRTDYSEHHAFNKIVEPFIDVNPRGVIPPGYYKKGRK